MNLESLKKYDFNSVVDVGAHHGNFYRDMCTVKDIKKENWLLIEANRNCTVALRSMGVPWFIAMLSNDFKTLPYYMHKIDKSCTGNSYYKEMTYHYDEYDVENISTWTLDYLVHIHRKQYDLIKIDTQGSEVDIMKGGAETMKTAKYALLETSIKRLNENAPLKDEVVEYMKSINYSVAEIICEVNTGLVHQEDILFVNEKYSPSNNVL